MAQLTRHRIASYTVESQRYVDYQSNFQYQIPDEIKNSLQALSIYLDTMQHIHTNYKILRELGIKKEDARYILPQATNCNLTFTMNLRSLINFWELRTDKKAQTEIRELAISIFDLVMDTLPNLRPHILSKISKS